MYLGEKRKKMWDELWGYLEENVVYILGRQWVHYENILGRIVYTINNNNWL